MRIHISIVAAFALLASSASLHAAVVNGDFETGSLSGWTLVGQGAAQTSSIGVTPPQGTYQGFIDNTGNFTVSNLVVRTSLGISGVSVGGLGQGVPTNGSGMSQFVTVTAGDVLSFDWNFLTSELSQGPSYNDFTFYTINSTPFFLASRNASTFNIVSPPAGFEGQTNWATESYTFPADGTYQIGYGIFNVFDSGHDSALLLDNITIVPEPVTMGGMLLLSLSLARRNRRA